MIETEIGMDLRYLAPLLRLCLLASLASAQDNPLAQISKESISIHGRLVDATTGEAMPETRMLAQSFDWATSAETLSGPDGRFAFTALPPKPHSLSAFVGGQMIYYSSRAAFAANGEIWTVGDTGDKEILFRVALGPIVTGVISDEFGDPVLSANVQLLRAGWQNGEVVFSADAKATTDDRGRFRFSPNGGSYILCARRDLDSASRLAPLPGPKDFLSSSQLRVYKRTCTSEPPIASFQVAPGDVREVNLSLASGPAFSVRGQITGGVNGLGPGLQLYRNDLIQDNARLTFSGTDFRSEALDPGSYHLRAELNDGRSGGSGRRVASQTIELGSADLSNLNLTLEPAPTVDVSIRGPANYALAPNAVQIGVRQGLTNSFADTQPDGSRRLANVDPGSAWLVTRTDAHVCVESARLQGQDVFQRSFVIPSGVTASLEVTLSTICSSIQGTVFSQNRPLPFAHLAILLSGSPTTPGDVLTENTDKEGQFQVLGLAPGRYMLWAWGRDDASFVGPVNLASVESQASVVVVGRGQTADTAVVAIPAPSKPK